MVKFLLVALLSIMMDGAAFAADAANVKALDSVTNTYLPVRGVSNGDGTTSLATASSSSGSSTTVKIKQPNILVFVGKFSVGSGAQVQLFTTDATADHYIISGFSVTTDTVFFGPTGVTTLAGAQPGFEIVTGSPPFTFQGTSSLYAISLSGTQTIVVHRVKHLIAP